MSTIEQRCPYVHGTVYADPYPGYVHGKNPAICPSGCLPQLTSAITAKESKLETLEREAVEYLTLFYKENNLSNEGLTKRLTDVKLSIQKQQTYELTYEELEYGCQVAWRNAPKCVNRRFWQILRLIDKRDVDSAEGMFEACINHIDIVNRARASEAYITVFKPLNVDGDGPRVFNSQLIRFAGHQTETGSVIGDSFEVPLTKYLESEFGWRKDQPNHYDVLPLVLQYSSKQGPKMFEIPRRYVIEVPLDCHEKLSDLGMKWYAFPTFSNMYIDIGGLKYACPFNGWYSVQEVVRAMGDQARYNMLPKIAERLELDLSSPIWRDHALAVLTQLVFHSYKKAHVTLVDHHALTNDFVLWYQKELKDRGFCPGNWKWIVPPIAANLTRGYLELKKMTEYTIKPSYIRLDNPILKNQQTTPDKLADQPAKSNENASGPKILILYGSVTGTNERYSMLMYDALKKHNRNVTILSMDDFNGDIVLKDVEILLIISCSYGAGRPPPSAKKLLSYLKTLNNSSLALKYAIFGIGSKNFPNFCGATDVYAKLMLEQNNFHQLTGIIKSDADFDTDERIVDWAVKLSVHFGFLNEREISEFQQDFKAMLGKSKQYFLQLLDSSMYAAKKPHKSDLEHLARVEEITQLSDGICVFLRLKMVPGSYWQYEPGDHLEVLAPNSSLTDLDLQKFCSRFRNFVSLDQIVDISSRNSSAPFPTPLTLRKLLRDYLAINEPISRQSLQGLPKVKTMEDATWIQFAERFEGELPIEKFLALIPAIKPRRYSLASAFTVFPEEMHLVVSLHTFNLSKSDQVMKGHCSKYLNEVIRVNDMLRCQVRHNPGFYLPANSVHPLVFIATGSGIAPIRGFWQQRKHILEVEKGTLGPALLFYGCRSPSHCLFSEEIEQSMRDGLLDHVEMAYSRQEPKKYVQHLLSERMSQFSGVFSHPKCRIYICGGSKMAFDVRLAIQRNLDAGIFAKLIDDERYHEDVFAIGTHN